MRRIPMIFALLVAVAVASTLTWTSSAQAAPCDLGGNYNVSWTSQANHRYVTAEMGMTRDGYGLLRARATVIGAWERFRVTYNTTTGEATVRSMANNRYVSAEVGWSGSRNGLLRARATSLGPWERFAIFV